MPGTIKITLMARIITKNKNILQSYIFTAAKYDFTAYEKRIMYRLVECAQKEIEGIKIKDNMHKILSQIQKDCSKFQNGTYCNPSFVVIMSPG